MAQGGNGRIHVLEHFTMLSDDGGAAISDATPLQLNDVLLVPVSGNVQMTSNVTLPNGVMTFSGAGGAGDGIAIATAPFRPMKAATTPGQGIGRLAVRFQVSVLTTWRAFVGFMTTFDQDETIEPFTLSGTTLTANNAGSCVGAYFDTTATTADWRAQASLAGVAQTAAIWTPRQGAKTTTGTLGARFSATPVAASYMYVKVELDPSGAVRFYYGDVTVDPNNSGPIYMGEIAAGTLPTTSLYHPVVMLIDPSTTDPDWNVDSFEFDTGVDWSY